MAAKAHVLYRNPHLGKALFVSAVGHGIVVLMLLVSPRWFPVPDSSASNIDAIEVQLFSAVVPVSESDPVEAPARVAEASTRLEPLPTSPAVALSKPAVPLPDARKLAALSELPEVLPKTLEPLVTSPRAQETVKNALKDVSIPPPPKPFVPIQEARKLAKLEEMPVVSPKPVVVRQTQAQVQEMVKEALREITLPAPVAPTAMTREARKLTKLEEMPVVSPKPVAARQTQAQVQIAVDKALKTITVPSQPQPVAPVSARPNLVEVPNISPILPAHDVADPGPLEVASLPSPASPAPSVYSELKVIRERHRAAAEANGAQPQEATETGSESSLPIVPADAQLEKVFSEYADRVKMVIDRNWHWQGNNNLELRVSVRFRIYPDGRATRVAIAQTSGNRIFDRAAIRAVKQLKQLPRYPSDIKKKFLDVEMDFSKVRAS